MCTREIAVGVVSESDDPSFSYDFDVLKNYEAESCSGLGV
jgi:hypothetical protein